MCLSSLECVDNPRNQYTALHKSYFHLHNVYRYMYHSTEKVAVKIIDKTKLDDQARRLLSREITCMECLQHRNLVRLFEVIDTFPRLYLVMECAAAGDLQARIASKGAYTEEQARLIFAQLVAAISHMVSTHCYREPEHYSCCCIMFI